MPLTMPWSRSSDGAAEPRVGAEVVDDHRLAGEEGVTRGRIDLHTQLGVAHEPLTPPRARPQQQRRPIGEELEDVAVFHREAPGDEGGGLVHQGAQLDAGERALAQLGDGGLLADSGLQHFLGAAPLGDLLMGRVERRHDLERRRREFPETGQDAHVLRVERPDVEGHGPDRPHRPTAHEEGYEQALGE